MMSTGSCSTDDMHGLPTPAGVARVAAGRAARPQYCSSSTLARYARGLRSAPTPRHAYHLYFQALMHACNGRSEVRTTICGHHKNNVTYLKKKWQTQLSIPAIF
jgi:hypothetical protein